MKGGEKINKRKNTVFILLLIALLVAALCGCDQPVSKDVVQQEEVKPTGIFVEADRGMSWRIVYHRDSKVMYVVGGGTFTLLVNADGSPMLWVEQN